MRARPRAAISAAASTMPGCSARDGTDRGGARPGSSAPARPRRRRSSRRRRRSSTRRRCRRSARGACGDRARRGAMLIAIPDVLDASGVAQVRALIDARRLDRRQRDLGPPIGARQAERAIARGLAPPRARRGAGARRAGRRAAVRRRRAAAQGLSAAVQPLRRRRQRSARMSTARSASGAAAISASAATCRRRSSSPIPTAMTAASW